MATKTLGTLATTTLTALQWPTDYTANDSSLAAADIRTVAQAIYDDEIGKANAGLVNSIMRGAFAQWGNRGQLIVPNRGVLLIKPGDWVAYDSTGWPILISNKSLPTTLTATGNTDGTTANVTNLSVDVRTIGWHVGMPITGTGVTGSSAIQSIGSTGKTLVLNQVTASSQTGTTLTVSNWTHS